MSLASRLSKVERKALRRCARGQSMSRTASLALEMHHCVARTNGGALVVTPVGDSVLREIAGGGIPPLPGVLDAAPSATSDKHCCCCYRRASEDGPGRD